MLKLLLFSLGFGEILIISFIYLIFFGSKNLPHLMRDFGRFFNYLRRSIHDLYNDFDINNEN
ncbi:MAG: twin-arginine translocase TatA/TatE family subunit [Flavobacteriales bacterium TMED191]|nr:MAG: twin-arginine translocase TatA/TatE family subunit [Flavobacteriales bacterium TMED191]